MRAIRCLFVLFTATGICQAETGESQGITKVYQDSIAAERKAFEDFKEIRAIDAATALQIPLEAAKSQVNVPAPSRTPIDTSLIGASGLQAAETSQERAAIRAVHGEIDDMISSTRQLLEQLLAEEQRAEQGATVDVETLKAQMLAAMEAASMAAENEAERAKDMTQRMEPMRESAAEAARTDARIAAVAAEQAAQSAQNAEAKAKENPEEKMLANAKTAEDAAQKAAEASRKAAEAALVAEVVSESGEPLPEAKTAAKVTSDQAAEAVYQALRAAIAAGELEAGLQMTDTSDAVQQDMGPSDPITAALARANLGQLVGSSGPGAPMEPGETISARGIGALGEPGTGWVRLDTWYLIGPFPNPGRQNVNVPFPPESIVDLDAIYTGGGGRPIRWTFFQSAKEQVSPLNDPPYVIYYAYTEFWSDTERELWIAVGSDDNSRIWLNGQLIWKSGYALKSWRRNEGLRKVVFSRGVNRILYRVENGHGASGFSFLIQTASPSESASAR